MEEGRRRPTLSHQMSVVDRSKLRDLVISRDEDDDEEDEENKQQEYNQTLFSVLSNKVEEIPAVETTFPPGRTLLDIIGAEESSAAIAYRGILGSPRNGHRINWKSFKDRLRIRRTGTAWTDSGPSMSVSADFMSSIQPRPASEISSPRVNIVAGYGDPKSQKPAAGVQDLPGQVVVVEEVEAPRVSLMSLLQADSQGVSIAAMGSVDDDGEEDEEEEEEGVGEYVCCVCMVRHKGAAFIPCGHTFCRLCSRELWVSRGNCPLCNGYILEILDIF